MLNNAMKDFSFEDSFEILGKFRALLLNFMLYIKL